MALSSLKAIDISFMPKRSTYPDKVGQFSYDFYERTLDNEEQNHHNARTQSRRDDRVAEGTPLLREHTT